eukprot:symbB.v1.2.006939.t1/scaffold421.1/size207896/2
MPAPTVRQEDLPTGSPGTSVFLEELPWPEEHDRSPVTPQQRLMDAHDLFEGHLAGLVKAFQLLQQQSYELLQDAPVGVRETPTTCCSVVKSPSQHNLSARVLDTWQSGRAVEDQTPGSSMQLVSLANTHSKKALAEGAEEKMIKDQFDRLTDQSSMVPVEGLVTLLSIYHPEMEFEDLQAMVDEIILGTDSQLSPEKEEQPNKMRRLRSSQATFSSELLGIKLDFNAFRRLRCGEVMPKGTLVRDVNKARAALRSEELHTQFMDEPVEEPARYYDISKSTARLLEFLPALVIVANSLSFAFQELVPANDTDFWEIVETCFMVFYLIEAGIKLRLMGCKGYFRGPEWAWNYFDMFCLVLTVFDFIVTQVVFAIGASQSVDLSILTLLKTLRLARLARLIRALRYPIFRELNLMVMGVYSGMRILVWAIVLLIVFIYVVAVAMNKLIGDVEQEFGTLMDSMMTLFRCFTDGCTAYDGTPLQERLQRKYGAAFFTGYILVFMLVTVGIFNLIMAIFIDNVMTSQLERKQRHLSETASDTEVALKDILCRLLKNCKPALIPSSIAEEMESIQDSRISYKAKVRACFDCLSGADVGISRDAFRVWLQEPQFLQVLEDADIDIHNKATLFDLMDADLGGSLSTDEVFHGLMQLRGPPTKGDIIGISLRVTHIAQLLQETSSRAL